MKRLTKVHSLMQNAGLNETTMLDELVLWLSNEEVDEFLEDLKTGLKLPEDVERCSTEH